MLDNGYVYLAATRLSLFRSHADWALAIEVFGFSPRTGIPDTYIYTFGSRLQNRPTADQYDSAEAYENYLTNNPNNESHSVYPIDEGEWQDQEDGEIVRTGAETIAIRGNPVPLPSRDEYEKHGIDLEEPPTIFVSEICRYLAAFHRNSLLATDSERRYNVPPDLVQVLQLEEWNHPDVIDETARPSGSETFQQLASVLATGDTTLYRPSMPPNTHWSNWPDGGTL